MTSWAERAAENLVSLSKSSLLKSAMREWQITGGYEDTHNIEEVCELCEHEGLRYLYEIENQETEEILWVGSTCITKFIPLFENDLEIVDESEKSSYLRRLQSERERLSREERAKFVLEKLADLEPGIFQKLAWIESWKMGYSAKQLFMVSVACRKFKIPFNSSDFRINTRRVNILQQIEQLEFWKYRRLRAALPLARQKEFDLFFLENKRKK